MRVLCFDVGGTSIKYSVVENDKILEMKSMPTRINFNKNYILEDILECIKDYENLNAIGISTAGVVDSEQGKIAFSGPTIPGYIGTEFKKSIEERYNLPTFVENDVNSAAFGEYTYANLKGTVFVLTIGTGVGGAIIQDGKIYKGNSMTAGEIGYMPLDGDHFQNRASATFLTNYVSEKLGKKVDGKYIFENAKKGDELCIKAIDLMISNLAKGILNIIYLLNPKQIIIGGGITAQKEYLEERIINKVDELLISDKFKTIITLAQLENSAGVYGIYNIVKEGIKNEI